MNLFSSDSVRSLHGQETEVLIVYSDLPTNDFASLAQNIYGWYSTVYRAEQLMEIM